MAMNPILPWHIASSSFCVFMIILIVFQVCRNPNKLRLSILGYSIMAIPPSIVNTLHVQGMISARTNAMVYLIATLLMTFAHFLMMLEVGYRLRIGEGNWKDPLVTVGMVFLGVSCILLLVQIGILAVNSSGSEEYPLKGCFIAGVVCSIIGHTSVFTYTFTPLIYWKKNRTNEGLSRITALGIWFFVTQNIWYTCYGALYVWFFVMNSWDYFATLLGIDYAMRFIDNVVYTWPPPKFIIDQLSSRLPNSSMGMSTRKSSNNHSTLPPTNGMSSERYNKEENVEYGNSNDLATPSEQRSVHSNDYGSKVTIVTR